MDTASNHLEPALITGLLPSPDIPSVIEITDYSEKKSSEFPDAEVNELNHSIKTVSRRSKLKPTISALSALLALIFIGYKIYLFAPNVTAQGFGHMLSAAAFGSSVETDQLPPASTDSTPLPSDILPPLSGSVIGNSPLGGVVLDGSILGSESWGILDDETLRQMIYSLPLPECGENEYPIKAADLSVSTDYGLEASNETEYELDLPSYLDDELNIPSVSELTKRYGSDAPVILIIHTHGTEAYAEDGKSTYTQKDNCRSSDAEKNVVAVGRTMAEQFESMGIPTLHCEKMFDEESYIDAYEFSSAAVREFTAIYPSIQYVFDVHRDSVIDSELTKLRPVTVIDGKITAQYMCVIGTDERSGQHPEWKTNLAFACQLQSALYERCPSLPRRLSVRSSSYYQNYAKGSLLLEIGSCGNTLSEAKSCGKAVAEEIGKIILEQ